MSPVRPEERITAEAVCDALRQAGAPLSKRDIARVLRLRGVEDRRFLKDLLHDMHEKGLIILKNRGNIALPDMENNRENVSKGIVEVTVSGISPDGDIFCTTVNPHLQGKYPLIFLNDAAAEQGERLQVSLQEMEKGIFRATIIHRIDTTDNKPVAGLLKLTKTGAFFQPLAKDLSALTFTLVGDVPTDAADGYVVRATPLPGHTAHSQPRARFVDVIGEKHEHLFSLIALENHGIRHEFPESVLREAETLKSTLSKSEIAGREDLRALPIVTIDGADAKDFDDAVWAEELKDGGYHIVVAIADVAHYVTEESELDKEAYKRGNSVYFPDMVIPMLPERLSNDLCSLRPHEDRPVIAAHLFIDKSGILYKHTFERALIRSHARLTYEQAQLALNGDTDATSAPVLESTLKPLYGAYRLLLKARATRGAIDLDVPERQIVVDENNRMIGVAKRERLDTHRLIEELMVLANVAAADSLQSIGAPCIYRIHEEPSKEKIDTLKETLKQHKLTFSAKSSGIKPGDFKQVVGQIKDRAEAELLMSIILRSQMQAVYSPDNIGHFGLALERYAHFTSPIRRYSDLLVHRSLVKNRKLFGTGTFSLSRGKLVSAAEHISQTERIAQIAEWEVKDRMIADYFKQFVGTVFTGNITSVQKFGFFVSIKEGTAEGLVPVRTLIDDYYYYDERRLNLQGKRSGRIFKIGDSINVVLVEADPIRGQLTFVLEGMQGSAQDRFSSAPQFGRRRQQKPTEEPDKNASKNGKGVGKFGHKRKSKGASINKKKRPKLG